MAEVEDRDPAVVLYGNTAQPEVEPEVEETESEVEETPAKEKEPETAGVPETEPQSKEHQTEDKETEPETVEVEEEVEEVEEVPISSLTQLLETEQYDPEWFDSLQVELKVDGRSRLTTIAELKASSQTMEAASNRLADAKAKVEATNQWAAEQEQSVQERLAKSAAVLELSQRLFAADEAELQRLRDEGDDVAYLAAKDRLADQRAAIQRVQDEAVGLLKRAQEAPAIDEQGDAERVAAEQAKLLEAIPEWKVLPGMTEEQQAQVRQRHQEEATGTVEYLRELGFDDERIQKTRDHRMFVMARKAMLYDRSRQKTQAAAKRVVKIPKVTKAGSPQEKPQKPKDQAEALYG